MKTMMTSVFALALAAAIPFSAEAQGKSRGRDSAPGQKCRAEGGTSNSRACRDRYGNANDRRDDRDSDSDRDRRDDRDSDRRDARRGERRQSNGSLCVDADRNGYCDARTSSRATTCRDSDRDGVCDWREDRSSTSRACVDRDRDGRCDANERGGTGSVWDRVLGRTTGGARLTLPLMATATRFARGERPGEVREWLGTTSLDVRAADRNRDGRPETATWIDRSGHVVQVWQDVNADGRADRVHVYQNGRVVRTID